MPQRVHLARQARRPHDAQLAVAVRAQAQQQARQAALLSARSSARKRVASVSGGRQVGWAAKSRFTL